MRDTCKNCQSENIIMVEYAWDNPRHYDGVSEIDCNNCYKRFGRWCGKELFDGGEENVHCKGESHE